MTAIDTLKKMLEDGEITEFDLPVGCLRNEARAKKALASLQPKAEAGGQKAYQLVKELVEKRDSIWTKYADAAEGSVGDFLGALSGETMPQEMPDQWQDQLSGIEKQLTSELLYTAYPYAVFVNDAKIISIVTGRLGYTPII